MSHRTLDIDPQEGPIINAFVGVSMAKRKALQDAGLEIPRLQKIRALIDTGASLSCIDPAILNALNLSPTGSAPIVTPSTGEKGSDQFDLYDISLLIPGTDNNPIPLGIENMPVVSCLLLKQGFHALIGRDVLSRCILYYDGSTEQFMLAF